MGKPGRTPREPDDKASFGYIVWLILGGKDANLNQSAQLLKIHTSSLSHIVHGQATTQKTILDKKWRETLAKHYPETWSKYSGEFEKYTLTLPTKSSLSKEPKKKESFGYILWLIIGGKDADLPKAAQRLKVDRASLTHICQSYAQASRKLLVEKKWRETLAKYYPDQWILYSSSFNAFAEKLTKCTGILVSKPAEKDRLAYVLWLILGKENTDIAKSSQRLKIDKSTFSAIFRGIRRISRKKIADKKWRDTLSHYYPETWKQYSKAFDEAVASQPTRAGVSTRPPKDTESFGYVLWLILGGKKTEVMEAAPRLNIKYWKLSAIFHDRYKIFQEDIDQKYWREILAAYYPDSWKAYATVFEQRVAGLPTKPEIQEYNGGFGYTLWLLLGGRKANLVEAAQRLDIQLSALIDLLHGKKRVSAQTLVQKNWRKIFMEHYPENWNLYEQSFERSVSGLPRVSKS